RCLSDLETAFTWEEIIANAIKDLSNAELIQLGVSGGEKNNRQAINKYNVVKPLTNKLYSNVEIGQMFIKNLIGHGHKILCDLIIQDAPYAAVVDDTNLTVVCSGCLSKDGRLSCCSSCNVIHYCSEVRKRS
ncbi:1831_t:CDS:2, partial [Gigaspora margarita]